MMKEYKKGDPCPCCGQPIQSDDPMVLYLLSWIGQMRRVPCAEEVSAIHRLYLSKKQSELENADW